jgi:hypothetical protein
MMPSGAAPIERAGRLYPTNEEWQSIMTAAKVIWESDVAKSMMIPNQAAIITVAMKGWELGVPLVAALEGINVIKGRPRPNGPFLEFLGARVRGWVEWVKDGRAGEAECIAHRPGKKPVRGIFSLDDAKRAGLMEKDTYKQYPADMLRRRALSRATWMQFSDLYFGFVPPTNEVVDAGFEDDDEDAVVVDNDGMETAPLATAAKTATDGAAEAKPKRGRPPAAAAQGNAPAAASTAAAPATTTPASAPAAPAASPGATPAPPASPSPPAGPAGAAPASPASAPMDDFMGDAPAAPSGAPEDKVLPFNKGKYLGKKLSELEKADFASLIEGYRNAIGNAAIAEDRRATMREWLGHTEAWAKYRGVEIP